jgi:hypothetical protein
MSDTLYQTVEKRKGVVMRIRRVTADHRAEASRGAAGP